jgi:uncharacterized membrane-anchored protein
VFEGLHDLLPYSKGVMLALSAPVVLLVVYFGLARLKKAH